MKKYLNERFLRSQLPKIDLKMKLTTFFLLVSLFQVQANSYAQKTKLTLNYEDEKLETVFNKIEGISEFRFLFETEQIDLARRVNLKVYQQNINEILFLLFENTNIAYLVRGRQIVLKTKIKAVIPKGNQTHSSYESPIFIQATVTGTIKDSNGNPLPGANVLEKGSTNGVTADFDGNFSITLINSDATLVISYIGFAEKEIQVNGQTVLDIVLEESTATLDEVIVVGYGSVKKTDLTGSVSTIDIDEINKVPVANIDQALQGMASGVFVTSTSGNPGSPASIRIRGGNSVNAGNEPLYVIDGFISDNTILSGISPGDIASISVLKDASATSIYGARGSNGVILISTKNGRNGKAELSISTSFGMQQIGRKAEMLSVSEYIDYTNQGEAYLGNQPAFTDDDIARIGNGTDWQDELSRSGSVHQTEFSIRGGDEKTRYYYSGNYFQQEGLLIGNSLRRISTRLNFSHKFTDFFEIGTNINFANILDKPANFDWPSILGTQPTLPVRQPDGSYTLTQDVTGRNFDNPVSRNEFIHQQAKRNQLLINNYVQFNFTKNLSWKSTLGYNVNSSNFELFTPAQLPINALNGIPGSGRVRSDTKTSLLTENSLTFDTSINDIHKINVLAGITAQKEEYQANIGSSINTLTDQLSIYGLGLSSPEFTDVNVNYDAFSLLSYIGRLNYSFKDKYLATLTARTDGSSKFGLNNRYAFFPSFAVAWRLSEEEFIKKMDFINSLKLKFSYGKTGNSNGINSFQRFQALQTVFGSLGRGTRDVGVINNRLPNDNLKWETTDQYDLGLEVGLFKGRLNLEFDVYHSITNDLLFTREIPSQAGFSSRLENIGSLENRGFDFSLNASLFRTENFGWEVGFNISAYKNEILDLGESDNITTLSSGGVPNGQLRVGEALGIFTGYVTDGVYADQAAVDEDNFTNGYTPGEFRFIDQNGDGSIDVNGDLAIIGDSNPDFYGGFQNTFRYKNIELSGYFQFSYGNDIFNQPKSQMFRPHENNVYKLYNNSWTPDNRETNIPVGQAINPQSSTDFNIEDGSFLRLRTLEIAYNFIKTNEKLPFNSARVYFTGTNLFQIVSSEFNGDDPEANAYGLDDRLRGYYNFGYPSAQTLSLGLEVKF